jgi:hypothetical protein
VSRELDQLTFGSREVVAAIELVLQQIKWKLRDPFGNIAELAIICVRDPLAR